MINMFRNHLGWGILISLLWGFFFFFIQTPLGSSTYFHLSVSFIYAFLISLSVFMIQKFVFPKLNSFPLKIQFGLKSFFFAAGVLAAYLLVFLFQLILFSPQQKLADVFSYGFFRSLSLLITAPISPENYAKVLPQNAISQLTTFSILLAMIALISIVLSYVDTRWKEMKAEKQIQEARLKILEMQMQPHFLFNALNTIVSVVRSNPEQAESLLMSLSDFLRFNFRSANRELVFLKDELEFTENYLRLMKARFRSKLEWQIKTDDRCRENKIPLMIIQPFVENAIKYGMDSNRNSVVLSLTCIRDKRFCIIKIEDNGPGIDLKNNTIFPKPGHSIDNILQRLRLHYAKDNLFRIESQPGKGTQIIIKIPDKKEQSTRQN